MIQELPSADRLAYLVNSARQNKQFQLRNCPEGRMPYNCVGNNEIAEQAQGQSWWSPKAKADPRDVHFGHYVCLATTQDRSLYLLDLTAHLPVKKINPDDAKLSEDEILKRYTGYDGWKLNRDYKK